MSTALMLLVLTLGATAAAPPGEPPSPGAGQNQPNGGVHPELSALLDQLVAAASKPDQQASLLQTAAGQGGREDKARSEAIETAQKVSRALAANKVQDPAVHKALFSAALSLDPATRRWAGEQAARTRPDTPASALTPTTSATAGAPSGGTAPGSPAPGGATGQGGAPSGPPPGQPAAMSADHLAALRRYKSESLRVSAEVDVQGGGTTVSGGVMVGASGGSGTLWYMPTLVAADPVETLRTWGVYQGPQRLEVPAFLEIAGETGRATAMRDDIHRAERNARIGFGVAGVGLAGVLGGVVGMTTADDPTPFARLAMAGSALSVGGFLGASFPLGKASRLTHDYDSSLTVAEANTLATRHNETLRSALDLSPDEVWSLERGTP